MDCEGQITDSPKSELEAKRPLTPEERSAYIETINRALSERMVVNKGLYEEFLRLGAYAT